jgi:hypothetical protein
MGLEKELLPIPNYLLPIPNSQFPIPNSQFPIPNSYEHSRKRQNGGENSAIK